MEISERVLVEYLRRSYHAVDGLWFMMIEKVEGFDRALETDRQVWEVVAKIQARKARELTNSKGNSPEELARCFSLKLAADGHTFQVSTAADQVVFAVSACPWLALLDKSARRHLALRVSQTICHTEGRTWCREFGGEYQFEMPVMMCGGAGHCQLRFTRSSRG
jgi:hypothetical protein